MNKFCIYLVLISLGLVFTFFGISLIIRVFDGEVISFWSGLLLAFLMTGVGVFILSVVVFKKDLVRDD